MYKMVFFVPPSHLDAVKQAVFDAGAGQIGDYSHCCWQMLGQGQFRPLPGSSPFQGDIGELESFDEYRVELVCEDQFIKNAVKALKASHPYEEPAYDIWPLVSL
jgi:hypothetical protein